MSADSSHRTLVLSVVAVDLVCYSQKSVAEQMSLKDHFNQVLLQAIRDISMADRIILDTGDGVAIGFLGDPEDALYVAMFMHAAINRDSGGSPSGRMDGKAIRIGINLGPVKLATGVGGHPNIIGDGINVAERIMSFAEPGQLTVSRPFYEMMSRMSDHYATLFRYAGVRTDKQIRAHDVYLVGKSAAAFQQAERGMAERAAQRAGPTASSTAIAPAALRMPATPARAPAKITPPSASATAKRVAKPAAIVSKAPAKPVETGTARAIALDEPHRALIDFLEDRNKVATTATLLAIVAVTLGALLAYRKLPMPTLDATAPAVVALSPAPAGKDSGTQSPTAPAPVAAPAPIAATSPAPADAGTLSAAAPAPLPDARRALNAAKTDIQSPPLTANPPSPGAVPPATKSASTASASTAPPAPIGPLPAKTLERPPLPTAATGTERDKPKDAKPGKPERSDQPEKTGAREEARIEPRKLRPSPAPGEREKSPTATAPPIVPTYQSPVESPRPALVAPTQSLPLPAAVDVPTVVVSRSAPPYPVEGIRQGIKMGVVKARLTIDAAGNVIEVGILESRPISAFGRETRTTLKQWKFNPGAPGRIYDIEITFTP